MAHLLHRHPNRPFTIGAVVALALAVQRFIVTFGTQRSECGDQAREHIALLFGQAMAAVGLSIGLALCSPDIVQGDRWYRRGVIASIALTGLTYILIFTKHGLMDYANDC